MNAGYTIEKASKVMGLSYQALWNMEHGKTPLNVKNYAKMCKLYGINPDDIKTKAVHKIYADSE